ncbi:MAG: ATP-binding protein [Mucinivorans sp.]
METKLDKTRKSDIRDMLKAYCVQVGSQNKAADILRGVSSAILSNVASEKWEKIADRMWLNLEAQLRKLVGGQSMDCQWRGVQTKPYRDFVTLLGDAQGRSMSMAIIAPAGSGKSFAAREYAANNANVYYVLCKEGWKNKAFLTEMLRIMGRSAKVCENDNESMFAEVVTELKKQYKPLIIWDEADKLHDEVMRKYIDLYNELEDVCGLVMCATSYLETRISNGADSGKRGYKEIKSRLGNRFVRLEQATKSDLQAICMANGIENMIDIQTIINESEGDLRRVKRSINSIQLANGTGN